VNCPQAIDVGVYVLGALSPADSEEFERHLGECEFCQEEVADLSGLPSLLGQIDFATAEAIAREGAAPAELREPFRADAWAGPTAVPVSAPADPEGGRVISLLDAAKHRRARQRRRGRVFAVAATLAAACLAVVVGLGVPALLNSDSDGPDLVAMTAASANVPITAEVGMVREGERTKVVMHCVYSGGSGTENRWMLRLTAVPKGGGAPVEVTNWSAGHGDEFELVGYTTLKPDQIERVEMRKGDGTVLLTYVP
jgi:anti-sigma factor RsiW